MAETNPYFSRFLTRLLSGIRARLHAFFSIPFLIKAISDSRAIDHITPNGLFDEYKRLYIFSKGRSEMLSSLVIRRPLDAATKYSKIVLDRDFLVNGFTRLDLSFQSEALRLLTSSEFMLFKGRLSSDVVPLRELLSNVTSPRGRYDALTQELYGNINFAKIVTSAPIEELAFSILGSYAVITSALMWASFSCVDFSSSSTSAQVYHVDFDYIDDIKLFILLSNTSLENGPLEYIAGTHCPSKHRIFSLSEMDEDRVRASFPPTLFNYFTGLVGDSFLSNNRGIHRDHPPAPGHCKLGLQINFSRSRFGSENYYSASRPILMSDQPSCSVWKSAIDRNPMLYSLLFKE